MVRPVVVTGRASVPVIIMASAASVPSIGSRVSGALGPPWPALVRRAARSAAVVAAAARAAAAIISITVVVSGETARRVALLCLHLVRGLAVSLGKLDLDLSAAHPLAV